MVEIWRTRGNILGEHEKRWRRKVKKEFKRAVRLKGEGFNGWYVLLNEDITGKSIKVKEIGTGRAFYVAKELLTTMREK